MSVNLKLNDDDWIEGYRGLRESEQGEELNWQFEEESKLMMKGVRDQ